MLKTKELSISFGGLQALSSVAFEVTEGQIVGIIGPNGAGKTTLFNCICRIYQPDEGDIFFKNSSLLDYKPYELAGLGISRTFQNVELFNSLTVLENVLVGLHTSVNYGIWKGMIKIGKANDEEKKAFQRGMDVLDMIGLADIKDRPVLGLPFGYLKKVELARAIISKPKLLLLDEPSGGMSAEEIGDLTTLLLRIRNNLNVTMMTIGHHINFIKGISDRVIVLNFGRKIAEGTPEEVANDKTVIEAYLGAEGDAGSKRTN